MRKNIAGQVIGAQMVSAVNGSAFVAGVAVAVTGDGGTQTPGAGTLVHEGNGFWSYVPTQAETNFAHIAFTFTGANAVPTSIQVYTELAAAGVGAITWPYMLTSSVDASPIADADVWVTSDSAGNNVLASGKTNQAGVVMFFLDAGPAFVWRQKSGWNFSNPDPETVA